MQHIKSRYTQQDSLLFQVMPNNESGKHRAKGKADITESFRSSMDAHETLEIDKNVFKSKYSS